MRILLTGAAGYIGCHIVQRLLAEGHRVTALVRSPRKLGPFLEDRRLEVVESDLAQETRFARLLAGQEACIHAALLWGAPGSELELRDTAVAARLFDAASRAGVQRCLYLSSTAVHRPFTEEMGEEDRLRPADVYGATKAAGELFLHAVCAQRAMTGVALRAGPVVGAPAWSGGPVRTHSRIVEMVTAAAAGHPIEVVRGAGRQFLDVAALATGIGRLLTADEPHATYLCVDRRLLTWEQVAQVVLGVLESTSEVRVVAGEERQPAPRFRSVRFEALLGGPSDAESALRAHIRHLATCGA